MLMREIGSIWTATFNFMLGVRLSGGKLTATEATTCPIGSGKLSPAEMPINQNHPTLGTGVECR
jgi:hypothetical protein